MADRELDRIHIRDLLLRCILGVNDEERRNKQDVNINVTMHADLGNACLNDRMEDTVDYDAVKQEIIAIVEDSRYFLVEHLAERITRICLEDPRVEKVDVLVEKPGALRFARTVGVEITRTQEDYV